MPLLHIVLILLVVVVWGVNFLFVKVALHVFPPFLLCALRFFMTSIPAVFFVRVPKGAWFSIFVYGFVTFVMQFGFIFWGIARGMPPGMAAILMQLHVFFSLLFAAVFLQERPGTPQIAGAIIAFIGIVIAGAHVDGNMPLFSFILLLGGAASLGLGNVVTKKLRGTPLTALVVWGCFFSAIPMLLLSLLLEGPDAIVRTYTQMYFAPLGALFYIVYASTWVGYGGWNYLLKHYSIGYIVPFTLLVPVVGMLGSVLFLDEPFTYWKAATCFFVLLGLVVNILGNRLTRSRLTEKRGNG